MAPDALLSVGYRAVILLVRRLVGFGAFFGVSPLALCEGNSGRRWRRFRTPLSSAGDFSHAEYCAWVVWAVWVLLAFSARLPTASGVYPRAK